MGEFEQEQLVRVEEERKSLYPKEEQFYSFCPVEFMDNMYSSVMTYVNEGFKAVEQGLREANGMSEEDMVKEGLVTMGSKPFFSRVQKEFDTNFDKFEIYALRNLFKLPEEVVEALKEPVKEQLPAPEDDSILEMDENSLDVEMEELQAKVAKQIFLNSQLKTDHALLQRKMKEFETILDQADFLQKIQQDTNDFVESTQKAVLLGQAMQKMDALHSRLIKKTPTNATDPAEDEVTFITRRFVQDSSKITFSSFNDLQVLNQKLVQVL